MQAFVDVPKRQALPGDTFEPVCLSCGNRRVFILESEVGYAVISTTALMALPDLANARCGRCRCRHCIIIDYNGYVP